METTSGDTGLKEELRTAKETIQKLTHILRLVKKILTSRVQAGVLSAQDVERVLSGSQFYYVRFAEQWRHREHAVPEAHPDGYAVIENAANFREAQQVATRVFGRAHLKPVPEVEWDFNQVFPRGEIKRIDANEYRRDT